jgi:hypothetical protein
LIGSAWNTSTPSAESESATTGISPSAAIGGLARCRIRVCSGNRPNRNYYSLRYKDRSFRVHAIECDECNIAGHAYGNEKCPGWMMVGEDPEVGYLHLLLRFDEDDAHRARHRAAKDLPLIVLAGLR